MNALKVMTDTISSTLSSGATTACKFTTTAGKSYSYWRLRILYTTMLGYAAFYLIRLNFSMALPGIRAEYGFTNTEIGYIISAASVVYGIGKLLNGYLSDKSNARYFLTAGLIGSAVMNFFMGTGASLGLLVLFWAANSWFQSMGFPPIARLLTHWFSPKEIGTKWSIWSCSHQIGGAAAALFAGYLAMHYGWRSAFFIPAIVAIVVSLFIFNRVRDTPKEVGLPPVEDYKEDVKLAKKTEGQKLTIKDFIEIILKNKLVWYVSIANLFLYIPRIGVATWAPAFLKEFKGADLFLAGGQVAIFDIAAAIGGIAAGWMSDKYFQSRRGPVGTLYLLLLAIAFIALWKIPANHPYFDTIALMFAGFLLAGPQVLVGIAMADFTCKSVVGSANGFAGFMAYVVGALISGIGVGQLVDTWGWNAVFILFVACSLIGALFFSLTWNARPRNISDNFKTSNSSMK